MPNWGQKCSSPLQIGLCLELVRGLFWERVFAVNLRDPSLLKSSDPPEGVTIVSGGQDCGSQQSTRTFSWAWTLVSVFL